jgi:hypothetical protein
MSFREWLMCTMRSPERVARIMWQSALDPGSYAARLRSAWNRNESPLEWMV